MVSLTSASKARALVAIILVASTAGACRSNRPDTTGSLYPHDVRDRHPIVLADGTRTLDVFPTGPGHLDPRQAADLDAFLIEFRRYGRGTLALDIPHGGSPASAAAAARTAQVVRLRTAQSGAGRALVVASYPVTDPSLAAPIRLSFQRMEAKVASKCGMWPQDLGVGSPGSNANNEPYWNLGCSTRSNMAAQIADPVDLVRARPEGRIDTVRRAQVIDKLRQGNDPSTSWRQDGQTKVGNEVGGN